MDYPLEQLGPERFQQLCQSLLTITHPKTQSFPIAQPDGGRDALSYFWEESPSKFIVFQVKFVRRPHAEADPHNWLAAVLEEELPKVKRLIPKGASQYVLLTNVAGTAHLGGGSIDRVNQLMLSTLGIPSFCWWRDDINRHLDSAWSLKWVYPELMTGPDLLRAVLESGLSDQRERRSSAIKAFLRHQYEQDEQVRFKQVELQNNLLDLFIDVPISMRDQQALKVNLHSFYFIQQNLTRSNPLQETELYLHNSGDDAHRFFGNAEHAIGASTFLLCADLQKYMPHLVLEGAPGQGKSTITQYVCQVHRMRLLLENEMLSRIPAEHKDIPARLPIRVDLRDLAAWLVKRDPFNDSDVVPQGWVKTLESFLAALIGFGSGGALFSPDDLLAIFKISSVLLVFDGLDEVADIAIRHEVVEAITKGVARLEENAASLQTVVTSRPAAFANSPGMPAAKYPTLLLLSLPRATIDDYADKWLRARRMDSRQTADFKKILKEKLDQPHLRDLARNPMQLAILLSLILTRGTSLPDKRTSLYDNYIDLFFNRESEKSQVVREHRSLLIEIHQYLAWILHVEVEQGNTSARIANDRLQALVSEYLGREGHDPGLSRILFTGMIERVVALVSRVQGTFEFEVQPLREYFAARFLYDTAPYSPPGGERRGTKPDRFDAIARNFFWLNVTRFYAGCFSKGELPALVERLDVLMNDTAFGMTSHPKLLASTLLSDWVFSQNPRSVQQVVELLLKGKGLRYLLASTGPRRGSRASALILPPKCGRDEVLTKCFEILSEHPPLDYVLELTSVLRENAPNVAALSESWQQWFDKDEAGNAERWFTYALHLGILSTFRLETLTSIAAPNLKATWMINLLYRARRLDVLEQANDTFEASVKAILDGEVSPQLQRRVESALDALVNAVDPFRYAVAFRERVPVPLKQLLETRHRAASLLWSSQVATATESYPSHFKAVDLAKLSEELSKNPAADWTSHLDMWDQLVERGRAHWGECWAFSKLAIMASAIRSSTDKGRGFENLYDGTASLCQRARHARLKSGVSSWWKIQLETARPEDYLLAATLAFTWGKETVLTSNVSRLNEMMESMSGTEWNKLAYTVRRTLTYAYPQERRSELKIDVEALPQDISMRTVVALGFRMTNEGAKKLYRRYFQGPVPQDSAILEFVETNALDIERHGTKEWNPDLSVVQECYRLGSFVEPHVRRLAAHLEQGSGMPYRLAEKIASQPAEYPTFLVGLAEMRCREEVSKDVKGVGATAQKEEWFSDSLLPL